jgi:tetratricopeptide (TPR) repeat protein
LTGKILRQDDHLVVRTSLLDSNQGITIRTWEDPFDTSDVPSLENNVANRVLSSLAIEQNDLARKSHRGSTTDNGEAFRQYLIGRYYWEKRDRQNLQTAIAAFQQSIDLDPSFSRPYAGLADSYVLLNLVAYGAVPTKDTMTKARAAAKKALEIDPNNAEAHTSLGVVLTKYDWNWPESEREFRQAIDLDPDYAAAHYWLSGLLAISGRSDDSIVEAEKARELDPFSPLVDLNLARSYYYGRQYDKALEVLANSSNVDDKKIRYMTGLVYLQKGMLSQSLNIFEDISKENRVFAAAALGYTYAKLGRRDEAMRLLAELGQASKDNFVMSQEMAIICIGLNEKEKALQYLNQAFQDRHGALIAIKVEPLFDPVRGDARFSRLLTQMSLN